MEIYDCLSDELLRVGPPGWLGCIVIRVIQVDQLVRRPDNRG
jgi:hypothetical protein